MRGSQIGQLAISLFGSVSIAPLLSQPGQAAPGATKQLDISQLAHRLRQQLLGFAPELGEGFLAESIHHPFSLEEIQLVLPYLKDLLGHSYHPSTTIPLTLRRKLLDHLVEFHAQHLAYPHPLKSLPIIRQLIR